ASEGLVAVSGNTMVEINSETDFVAKNAEFKELAAKIAEAAAAVKANSQEELAAADVDGKPAAEVLQEMSAKIGEKLELRRAYTGEGAEAEAAAKAAAMQVAALRAGYLTREDVPADIVEKERSIAEQITREEGKPEQAIPKIVEGRLQGFYKDVVLLEQASVA